MADGSLIFDTKVDTDGIKKGLGGLASTSFKALTASVALATTAVTALGASALSSYAEFEQLTGGVETLFKDSSGLVEQYAADAYKTAGLSANQYMSTVTSFSASLLQSLGGDTEAAAKYADQAIIDMSDNANKMGTSMEMIQNAYQGFAKQNYTMLDNLKLGYGGTKEEMQRLLDDASALSGIEYDISSFSDVTEAIHVVQSEMGITGTTAKEASTTIEGSVNSMKSAWANLVTGIADDNADFDGLIQNFVDSVGTVGENVLPRVETIIGGIGELIGQLLPIVMAEIPVIINDVLPDLLESGANMVQAILDGLLNNLPTIVTGAMEIISQLAMSILGMLPTILELGLQLIINLALGIAQSLPTLIPTIVEVITNMVQILVDNIPMLLDAAIQIMEGLTEGIIEALPVLIEALPAIIEGLINAIIEYIPLLMESTLYIMAMLVQAIFDNIPVLIDAIIQILLSLGETIVNQCAPMIDAFLVVWDSITEIFSTAWDNIVAFLTETIPALIVNIGVWFAELPGKIWTWLVDTVTKVMTWRDNMIAKAKDAVTGFIDKAIEIIKGLPGKIAEWLGNAVAKVQEWKSGLVEKARDALSSMVTKAVETVSSLPDKMKEVGTNLIHGIWNGISNATQWLYEKISGFVGNVTDKIKSLFGIHSPSTLWRDEVGHWLGEGIVVGFDEDDPMGQIDESLAKDVKGLSKSYAYAFDGMANVVPTTNLIAGVQSSAEVAKARATGISNNATQNINFNYPVQAPDEVARAIRQQDYYGLAGA